MTISTIFLHLYYSSENIICIEVVFQKIRGILIAKIYIIPSTGESLLINSVTGYVNKFCLIYLLSVFIVPSIEIRPAHPIHFKIDMSQLHLLNSLLFCIEMIMGQSL